MKHLPAITPKIARPSAAALLLVYLGCAGSCLAAGVQGLVACGHDSRIDLKWTPSDAQGGAGYNIYRSADGREPFVQINDKPHVPYIYSDFLGENNRTFYYRVVPVATNAAADTEAAPVVSARSREMSDDELLTSVQEATFRYFWDDAHPASGLIRERSGAGHTCATGGTGFGLFALMVGAERGFAPRAAVAERTRTILAFLEDRTQRFHGAFSHWIHGATGKALPFSAYDNGADLVETAFLIQGVLAVRQYFGGPDAVETEIRQRATRLWEGVEWDWFLKEAGSKILYWHWSPDFGWKKNVWIAGWNEGLIAYLLAIASPTHPIPAACYYGGWARPKAYANGNAYFGIPQWVGKPLGGALFFTQYSFLGFDPRNKRDRFCDYFANNRNISLIQRAYCIDNPGKHRGYGELVWGLTPSSGPDGYRVGAPGKRDDGTIAPTAVLGVMPYVPAESMASLKHLYRNYGKRLWGEYGFKDAFNLERDWFAEGWLAIDQGPIIAMIENHRTGLCWRMFMANPEIAPMLKAIGWQTQPTPELKR